MYLLNLKLTDTAETFKRKTLAQFVNHFQKLYNRHRDDFLLKTKYIILTQIELSPEYQSLLSYDDYSLRGQLGIVNPEHLLKQVFAVWSDEIVVEVQGFNSYNKSVLGSIIIKAIYADFSKVLQSGAAEYISKNKKGEETWIPWLRWLLLYGTQVVVTTHFYRTIPKFKTRTGLGWMHPIEHSFIGTGWHVPAEYSGTIGNNWITRAINNALPEIQNLFIELIMDKI